MGNTYSRINENWWHERTASDFKKLYLSRRKLASDPLVGGNIAIQDIELWKKTIALDLALLKVIKYIPWYDVISDVNIKKNLRIAMTARINASNIARMCR